MLRTAVFSDIHGNCFALDAMLEDLRRYPVDRLICLGDTIQGGAQPGETMAHLHALGCPVVLGNADAWLLTARNTSDHEAITARMETTRQWSLSQLSAADRERIAAFAPTVELPLEGNRHLLCFHGSPTSFDDLLLPETSEEEMMRLLGPFMPNVLTGGHTHLQQVRRVGSGFFFNPGSVGQVYDRHRQGDDARLDPWAEYAVLSSEGERLALEFRRVPYDLERLREMILASGHPFRESLAAEYAAS